MKAKKTKPVRQIATRNGVPCSLDKVECRAQGFVFSGAVLFPLPLPPCDPHVFRSAESAERAIARSERLGRKVRQSIIRDFVIERFPSLKPFAVEASFAAQPHKKN